MKLALRRGPTQFQRASDGSMTLIEHVRELRNRLFKASLAILIGFVVGYVLSKPVLRVLQEPYCNLPGSINADGGCTFVQLGPADYLVLQLKVSLWVGLIVACPVWLYQLWAFIAPGLHRNERRWAYVFTAIAAPLFALGSFLAFFVVEKGLEFLLSIADENVTQTLEISRYISFVTNLILIFGVAFEFPLIVLLLNFTGMVSAKRMLGWWRVAVFIFFVFSAVVTPTPDPFGMTALALALCALYFIAVGVAFINDRRKARRGSIYGDIGDDEISPLPEADSVEAGEPVDAITPVAAPRPLERRYDDMT
jgi:sec-independent protein translocase protein TatC